MRGEGVGREGVGKRRRRIERGGREGEREKGREGEREKRRREGGKMKEEEREERGREEEREGEKEVGKKREGGCVHMCLRYMGTYPFLFSSPQYMQHVRPWQF